MMNTTLIVIVALILAAACLIFVQNNRVPELGVNAGLFKPLSSKPNGVSSQATEPAKKVMPLPYKSDAQATLAALKKAINLHTDENGSAEVISQQDHYLYVVLTTPLMHYHDDVEFYLDEQNRVVHFRSSSRAGYSDMGLNAKRYQQLAALYAKL